MRRYNRLVPECFAETSLLEYLQYKKPNHQHGIGDVLNEITGVDDFCIGIIDNDKCKPGDLKGFIKLPLKKELETGIQLYQLKHSYVIIIFPAFEAWIINMAKKVDVTVNKFIKISDGKGDYIDLMIPKNLKDYITKNIDLDKSPDFKRFLTALREKNPLPFDTIQGWCRAVVERKAIGLG